MSRRPASSASRRPPAPHFRRLRLEPLEDRRLLAVFMVTNLLDAGPGSLRQAVLDANAEEGRDEVRFDPFLSGTLSLFSGEMEVTDELTITGPGADRLTIDARQRSRIFNITGEVSGGFRLSHLKLVRGRTTGDNSDPGDTTYSGGAIRSTTTYTVHLEDVVLSDNSTTGAYASGGAVFAEGWIFLRRGTISENSTLGDFAAGGGLHADSIDVFESTIDGNSTSGRNAHGGGVSSVRSGGLSSTLIVSNRVTGDGARGGAMWSGRDVKFLATFIVANTASDSGGGIFAQGNITSELSDLLDNEVVGMDARGGGMFAEGAVSIEQTLLSENRVNGRNAAGAGVFAGGPLTMKWSTVSENRADGDNAAGSGVFANDGAIIQHSAIFDNHAGGTDSRGGGLFLSGGTATFEESTISGNTAIRGGGVYGEGDVTEITRSTIANNQAPYGGGLALAAGTTTIDGSIVAANTADILGDDLLQDRGPGFGGLFVRYSLIGDNTGSGLDEAPRGLPNPTGVLIGGPVHGVVDPRLWPLADNGGLTLTHEPMPGSPAINAGDPEFSSPPRFDQRWAPFVRVARDRIDMGAFERQLTIDRTLVVDTLVDEQDGDFRIGDLSLREAIAFANSSLGPDEITFAPGLAGTIQLGLGTMSITDELTIIGPGREELTIDANRQSNIFEVNTWPAAVGLTLSDMLLTGGQAQDGGAVFFFSAGTLTLDRMDFVGNRAGGGGAVGAVTNLTVTESTFSENTATSIGGAIAVAGEATITDSIFSDNAASDRGGAIHAVDNFYIGNQVGRALILERSVLSGNRARHGGGGIQVFKNVSLIDSSVIGNWTTDNSGGGGVRSESGVLLLRSTVADNRTMGSNAKGGGVYASGILGDGEVAVFHSTLSGNRTSGPDAPGGAVWAKGGVAISSSTIVDNETTGFRAPGGGVFVEDGLATISASIIAGNSTSGESPDLRVGSGELSVFRSLIGDGSGTGLAEAPLGRHNPNGNLIGGPLNGPIDPLLGPLADNGGPTLTHEPLPGSPAIDAVSSVFLPQFDQRGAPFVRMFGGLADMGSVEWQPPLGLPGDTNDDGVVDLADLNNVRNNFGASGEADGTLEGDAYPFDGLVDLTDLNAVRNNFGAVAAIKAAASSFASNSSVARVEAWWSPLDRGSPGGEPPVIGAARSFIANHPPHRIKPTVAEREQMETVFGESSQDFIIRGPAGESQQRVAPLAIGAPGADRRAAPSQRQSTHASRPVLQGAAVDVVIADGSNIQPRHDGAAPVRFRSARGDRTTELGASDSTAAVQRWFHEDGL